MMRERMGSGGPPGLQILVPGTFGVRGGFDSHAFPPSVLQRLVRLGRGWRGACQVGLSGWLLVLMCALATPVHAQTSEGPPLERVDVVGAKPVAAKPDSARKRPWHEQPRFVMFRSLVIPGWGQLHNHAWFKAVGVAAGEGYMISRIVDDQKQLDRLVAQVTALPDSPERDRVLAEYDDRFNQRLGRQWLLGAVVAYALIDAYVDANFRGFDVEFQNDPALPGGPGSLPGGSGHGAGVRLLLRRHF